MLCHLSSLGGPHFLGDLGPAAHAFVDFLTAAGQSLWQMLPVNPIGDGFSPYSTISSFAGEPMLVSLELLARSGLLSKAEIAAPAGAKNARKVDYAKARKFRNERLRLASERALGAAGKGWRERAAFEAFVEDEKAWLDDYTLFAALTAKFETADFTVWPAALRDREPEAMRRAAQDLAAERSYLSFVQFQFARQWAELRKHAKAKGIGLVGDLPIFVSCRSADVWAARRFFRLDAIGKPTVVAGCPPDSFNADGQLWGNALYDWDALEKEGFDFWVKRIDQTLKLFDSVRLDHFIGFYRYWEIPAKAKNARGGAWRPARGDQLFARLASRRPELPFIAEDLGAVVPEVRALRDKYGLAGMKVLQFGFDGTEEAMHHRAHALPENSAVYTGTHDNPTTRGWLEELEARAKTGKGKAKLAAAQELERVRLYLGTVPARVADDLARAALFSRSRLCVLPIQDWLGEGAKARMNVPGVATGNWVYRVPAGALNTSLAERMRALTELYGRLPAEAQTTKR